MQDRGERNRKTDEIINRITQEEKLYDFLQEAKENSKKLENTVGKTAGRGAFPEPTRSMAS